MEDKPLLLQFAFGLGAFFWLYLALYFYDIDIAISLRQQYKHYFYIVGLFFVLTLQLGIWETANRFENNNPQEAKRLRSYVKKLAVAVIAYIIFNL